MVCFPSGENGKSIASWEVKSFSIACFLRDRRPPKQRVCHKLPEKSPVSGEGLYGMFSPPLSFPPPRFFSEYRGDLKRSVRPWMAPNRT